jgi:YD repeat-containing protein
MRTFERTYDAQGNKLTCKYSEGTRYEYTYDAQGNELTCKELKML